MAGTGSAFDSRDGFKKSAAEEEYDLRHLEDRMIRSEEDAKKVMVCWQCSHHVCICPKMWAPDQGHISSPIFKDACGNCGLSETSWRALRLNCASARSVAQQYYERVVKPGATK